MHLPYFQSSLLSSVPNLKHGFFTRKGGVSEGEFSTLNCSYGTGDSPEAVAENRGRIIKFLMQKEAPLITLSQIHSAQVHVLKNIPSEPLKGDALVTTLPNVILGVFTADCVPILLSNQQGTMVGAIHAGWRGALEGVIENTIDTMVKEGAKRENILAAIGPCIWSESYQVAEELYEKFSHAPQFFVPHPQGGWFFDLTGYVHHQLLACGLSLITPSPKNTYEESDFFFSCRRSFHQGKNIFGRFLSAICLTSRTFQEESPALHR